jgi:hypothetical protein
MSLPRYQEVSEVSIPIVEKDGAKVRVVAGEFDEVKGPVSEIAANPVYFDVRLSPATQFIQPIPEGHTALAYVYNGRGTFGLDKNNNGENIEAVHLVVFNDGGHLKVQAAPDASVRFMLIAGAPFEEPIVPYGPFVMNTEAEIKQALADLRNGTFVK